MVERRGREHPVEEVGAADGAGELGHHVGEPSAELHAAGRDEAQRHRRVDVAARDGADGVDQGDEHEPEGEGGGHHAGGDAARPPEATVNASLPRRA